MIIRTEVREIDKHIRLLASTRVKKIAIISMAQGRTKDEHHLAVMALVKRRIISGMA